jgi:hypothetical protein
MKLTHQSKLGFIATLLIVFIMATRVLAGQTYILTAIENGETYSGTCVSFDPDCSTSQDQHVRLEAHPSGELNLAYHLMANLASAEMVPFRSPSSSDNLQPYRKSRPFWIFATRIFHPPKA